MNILDLKTHILFLPVDRLEQVELASLNNVVDCSWLDERTESTDLNNVVGTIMINQQPFSYMIENVVRE